MAARRFPPDFFVTKPQTMTMIPNSTPSIGMNDMPPITNGKVPSFSGLALSAVLIDLRLLTPFFSRDRTPEHEKTTQHPGRRLKEVVGQVVTHAAPESYR